MFVVFPAKTCHRWRQSVYGAEGQTAESYLPWLEGVVKKLAGVSSQVDQSMFEREVQLVPTRLLYFLATAYLVYRLEVAT